jgi:hypothetical protein
MRRPHLEDHRLRRELTVRIGYDLAPSTWAGASFAAQDVMRTGTMVPVLAARLSP